MNLERMNRLFEETNPIGQENLLINDPLVNEIVVIDETIVTGSVNDEPENGNTDLVKEALC